MDKLKFSFRLYDMDNNGVVDMEEVTAIIETLDSIEGVKPGRKLLMKPKMKSISSYLQGLIFYDGGGNSQPIEDTRQRAFDVFKVLGQASLLDRLHNSLFQSIDKDLDPTLTFEEFVEANSKGSEMHRRQASVLTKLHHNERYLKYICYSPSLRLQMGSFAGLG